MNKAWWNYEKDKYKKRIQQKEESLQIHIKELDRLRAENKRLVKKLNLACVNGSALMKELLNSQQEIISSPIRFNGVSNEDIKRIFAEHGIKYEQPF